MTSDRYPRRRPLLPGQTCPKCGGDARAIHLRYQSKGKELDQPIRTFKCKCGKTYTYPADDLPSKVGYPNP
jgi:DNA-directed RNA polymerase subunit M/transcription elongation factor TFIIS